MKLILHNNDLQGLLTYAWHPCQMESPTIYRHQVELLETLVVPHNFRIP